MAIPTRRQLMDRIKALESENEDLEGQLDEIADIVTPSEDGDNEGEDKCQHTSDRKDSP